MKRDWDRFDFTKPTISVTKAECVNNCSLKYKFTYEDKIPTKPSRALEMGSAFDDLCDSGEISTELSLITDDEINIIKERYAEYLQVMPKGITQVPFQKPIGCGDWSVIGFIDLMPDEFPDVPIIEIKFSQTKWNAKKVDYKMLQASLYAWAFDHDWVQFNVMNFEKPGLQIYDKWIGEPEIDKMLDDLIKAVRKIEEGVRTPEENKLCGWCDYQEHCPIFKSKDQEVENGNGTYFDTEINK